MRRRLVVILVLVLAGCGGLAAMQEQGQGDELRGRVVDVVDGDTLKVRLGGEVETVRLLGIDTPETRRPGAPVECGGPEATSEMLALAFSRPRDRDGDGLFDGEGGRGIDVTVRTDPTQDERDRFDRLLAYIEPSLQRRMLESGWAEVYVYERNPFQRVARFRAAERAARQAGRGVWGRCGGNFHARGSASNR
jgi:micrococcal nuclease